MIFKRFNGMLAYVFDNEHTLPDGLDLMLEEFKFTPCGSQDKSKFGWVPAIGGNYVHQADGVIRITSKRGEKKIKASALAEKVKTRVEACESEFGRPLSKKECDNIKDDIITELLPHTLPDHTWTDIIVIDDMIVVSESSAKKAEGNLALLRKSVGSLPVVPLFPAQAFESVMMDVLKEVRKLPSGLELGEYLKVVSVKEDGGSSVFKGVDLMTSEAVWESLNDNMVPVEVEFTWQERVTFKLSDSMQFKSVKWSDDLLDQNDDIPRSEVDARTDADFALLAGELRQLVNCVMDFFGGRQEVV